MAQRDFRPEGRSEGQYQAFQDVADVAPHAENITSSREHVERQKPSIITVWERRIKAVEAKEARQREFAESIRVISVQLNDARQQGTVDNEQIQVLSDSMSSLQGQVEQLRGKSTELESQFDQLRERLGELPNVPMSERPSLFDEIGQTVLGMAVGAIIGGLVGGAAIAYLQHAPFVDKFVEGMIGGATGSFASDVARNLGPKR